MFNSISPVVLFVYNRPWHTCQTVQALLKNELACQTDLIVFSDAAKDNESFQKVEEVRSYLYSIEGFKSVRIVERKNNKGLAKSIIEGVTDVVSQYGKVIVLEDDIVTSPEFLNFMNQALDFYEKEKRIWHISGWSYPIDFEGVGDAFLWRVMNCWGWATWRDRWAHFEKNPKRLVKSWNEEKKAHFDLDGSGIFWNQVVRNAYSGLNTWAIFWYATIYENNGLCLNPSVSYVENIGHDGSGTNCGSDGPSGLFVLNTKSSLELPVNFQESQQAVVAVKKFYKNNRKSLPVRAINKLSRAVFGGNLIK